MQDVISSRIITHRKSALYTGIGLLTAGTLFVVATPIGNLEDLSPRARRTLQHVDVIAAEDTRHTGKLLSHFAIKKRQIALHDHNEAEAVKGLIEMLLHGQSIALVSDAGTPLVSDPGFRLVQSAHNAGIVVTPIPGASAAIAAMSAAGLPSDRFAFEGFLPAKRESRVSKLKALRAESRTLVFFESVHRIKDALHDMADVFGAGRQAFIGREISKLHEQCVNATLQDLCRMLDAGEIVARGEFVVIVAGASDAPRARATINADELLAELVQVMPGSQAVDIVTRLSGGKRNEVYRDMLKLRSD